MIFKIIAVDIIHEYFKSLIRKQYDFTSRTSDRNIIVY